MNQTPPIARDQHSHHLDVARYAEQGFMELGPLVDPADVATITELFDRLDAETDLPASWEPQYDESTGERRLRKLRRLLWNRPELFAPILCRAGLPEIAEAVIGPDAVVVFSAAFLKPARIGTAVGLHQDQALWSKEYPSAFSAWIALTDVGPHNGGLAGRPASHQVVLPHSDDPDHPWHPTLAAVAGTLRDPHEFVLNPGEVVMWDRLFAHSSAANDSDRDRRGMVVVFADGGAEGFDPIDSMSLDEIRRHARAAA